MLKKIKRFSNLRGLRGRPRLANSRGEGEDPFSRRVRELIHAIPAGKVATYGQIAYLAGKPNGARQVAWILHSSTGKYRLPWQRVIGGRGAISLAGTDFYEQRRLLGGEGVRVDAGGRIDLDTFRWEPE